MPQNKLIFAITNALRWILVLLSLSLLSGCLAGLQHKKLSEQYDTTIHSKLEKPKLCLSLSGGGLRSAAFSTGILKGLYHKGYLNRIDIVSATSGGTWSVLWLNARLNKGLDLAQVYGTPYQTTEVLDTLDKKPFISKFYKSVSSVFVLAGATRPAYYGPILQKFGSNSYVDKTSLSDLKSNVVKHNLPVPVFTLSVFRQCGRTDALAQQGSIKRTDQTRLNELVPMLNHQIELSPGYWGSDHHGRATRFPRRINTMEEWALRAGSAVDHPNWSYCKYIKILSYFLGVKVNTPNAINNKRNDKTYMADGGMVDNLSARNLIKRNCKKIIMVDSTHDPALTFFYYRKLKQDVKNTAHKTIVVPRIDTWLKRVDVNDTVSFRADDAGNPIVSDNVTSGCITNGKLCKESDPKIVYIKLTMNPQAINSQLRELSSVYQKSSQSQRCRNAKRGYHAKCSFPQDPTTKLEFSRQEFKAYRLLGEDLILRKL